MWSVKTVPKDKDLTFGLSFLFVVFVIRIASVMTLPLPLPSEDYRLAIEPEHLSVHVGDLAETRVVLHRIYQHRHDVAAVATGVGELLEPALDAAQVARGLEARRALDLLGLDLLVDSEIVDRLLVLHDVLVDADGDLVATVLHQLVAIGGVR